MLLKSQELKHVPQGLIYFEQFLSSEEQRDLIDKIEHLPSDAWQRIFMRGREAKREMICYGWNYLSSSRSLGPAAPMPIWLKILRDRCVAEINVVAEDFRQAILARYPRTAGLSWHTDHPAFGPIVFSVSLRSAGRIEFEPSDGSTDIFKLVLEPGSLLIMRGASRSAYKHRIVPVKDLRYSITFRSVLS